MNDPQLFNQREVDPSVDSLRTTLLAETDFKWLMAGQGWWVDTERLEHDHAYAVELMRLAIVTNSTALRESAARLLRYLPPGILPSTPLT